MAIASAKLLLSPDHPTEAWLTGRCDDYTIESAADGASVTLRSSSANTQSSFTDNVPRLPVAAYDCDPDGDTLPQTPVVLTGCGERWPAFRGGEAWSVVRLAERLPPETQVRLDGGPSFARESLCNPYVTMADYAGYCR